MGTKSSFYSDSETVYSDTNPAGPSDAPQTPTSYVAPSSFYKSSGKVEASMMEANFTIAASIPGTVLLPSEWLFGFKFDFPGTFDTNMDGSLAVAAVAATSTTVLSLRKNGVQFATLSYSGTTGTFSSTEPMSFVVGDLLELVAPSSADATLALLTITLFGTRN